MTVAQPKPTTERIVEGLTSSNIDAENGVIKNVKLIGFVSKNGRLYPPAVLKSAVHHYEGAKVNINHPLKNPAEPRQYQDRFGVIRAARFVEDSGIFGGPVLHPSKPARKRSRVPPNQANHSRSTR